jgi:4-hydroxybenzoate polyprenyltransferase
MEQSNDRAIKRFKPYLQLIRPPNLLTAMSDIWAGIALSAFIIEGNEIYFLPVILLSLSAVFLYAGGVVMNDVFDAELDQKERPERPIPSGRILKSAAATFGMILLAIGVLLALIQSLLGGLFALLIAIAAVVYDKWGKPHPVFGPINMGVCRGLNLLLGMSVLPMSILSWGWVAIVPVIYIAAVTMISRGEVYGGKRSSITAAFVFYLLVIILVAITGFLKDQFIPTLVFLFLFALMVFPPLLKALKEPSGPRIGRAVKAGVLALILLNAAWVAAGAGIGWAVITALLLPLSILIAKYFAVT